MNAGNLTNDTYTGTAFAPTTPRTRSPRLKVTNNQDQLYGYDGSGQRIKRTVNGVET